MSLQTVLENLVKLTPNELATVAQHLKALQSISVDAVDSGNDEDLVLGALTTVLSRRGVEHPNKTLLKRSGNMKSFREKLPDLMKYLSDLNRNERLVVLHIGFDLLYKNMLEMNLPVSPVLMMAHIHRLPSILNMAFPGYRESGLLNVLAKRKV